MPKALWKGSISFGLVNIPVRLYPATKSRAIQFNMLCGECHTPLRYKRWCSRCEKEIDWRNIDRGYEITKDHYVTLTKAELEGLQLKTAKAIEIQKFADFASIDSLYLDKHYYLAPEEGGEKAYSLLHDVLAITDRVAVGKIVMHNKEHVVALRPYQKGLVLTTMHYPSEIVDIGKLEELEKMPAASERERGLAETFVEHMRGDFDPKEYVDRYRKAVMQIIKQKAEGKEVAAPVIPEVEATKDLMEALKASVRAVKKEAA